MDMSMHEPPAGSMADLQRQINALVTELALKERQLRDVSVDDLARVLIDAQQTARDLRARLATKDEELSRIKLQLKQLNSGNDDAWDKIVADASAECIRLRREVDEWKARDLEAARRWSEQQETMAAYMARISELETLVARQRDASEEDGVARDTEIRAMNKRMQEIAGANDPSKVEAAKFLVDQVTEQEKAMRLQKDHAMQLETRMLELKRENEYMRNTLYGYDPAALEQGGSDWQPGALQRLQDQLTELRAQGSVQRVVMAEEALAREQIERQRIENHLLAVQAQDRRREVTQDDAPAAAAMQDAMRAKDKRINQLEEAKYRLDEENAAMARKLEELQRKDALNRARSSKGTLSYPVDPLSRQADQD